MRELSFHFSLTSIVYNESQWELLLVNYPFKEPKSQYADLNNLWCNIVIWSEERCLLNLKNLCF